jgi:hypothetical protein
MMLRARRRLWQDDRAEGLMPPRWLAGIRFLLDRHQSHEAHQPPDALFVHGMAIVALVTCHLADAEEGRVQEMHINLPHQREVLFRRALRRVVERRPCDRQKCGLRTDRLGRMVARSHAAPHVPPQALSFRDKKELATAFDRSLERMAFAASSHDLGVQVPDLVCSDHRCMAAAAFKDTGGALKQGAFPLVDHRRMHTEPARQFRHGLLTFQRLQGHLRLELRGMLLSFRYLRSLSG